MDETCVKKEVITDRYAIYNGDSCEILPGIPSNSVHFEIYSPPITINLDRKVGQPVRLSFHLMPKLQ